MYVCICSSNKKTKASNKAPEPQWSGLVKAQFCNTQRPICGATSQQSVVERFKAID